MTIEDEIKNMYAKRLERKEIKREVSSSTLYQHENNLKKIHQAITGNTPQLFGQMGWLEEKTGEEIFEIIKTIPGRKGSKLGIAAQRQYLTSVLVAIRVFDFYKGQDSQLFKDISDLLQIPLKKEMDTYRDQLKEETKETLPEYNDIMKIVKNYIDTADHTHLDMKILLRIYTIYPIRLEAADLIYIEDHNLYRKMKKKELINNYAVIGKKKILFSFSDYKTSVKYGTVEIVVKDKLLKNLLQQKGRISTNGESMFNISRNTMSKNITTFFEKQGLKNVSPTTLAKVIETNAYNSIPEEERSKMKTLAEFRRHSLDTQSKFYIH